MESLDEYVEALEEAAAADMTYLRIDVGGHGVAYEHSMEPSVAAISEFFERTLAP